MRSVAVASFLYDPINLITVDAQIAPYVVSEQDLLVEHLKYVGAGDILLLDRGYPSMSLFYRLAALGVDFCVRMKEDSWKAVKAFRASGERDAMIEITLPAKDAHLLEDYPQMAGRKLQLRLVRVELEGGVTEILCTSLVDDGKFLYEDFKDLYHCRWNVEESFKLFKSRLEIENFSGKTAHAVKQDFYAKVFMMSLCALLAFPIEERVRKESEDAKRKHPRKINRTFVLGTIKDIVVNIFIRNTIEKALTAFDDIVSKTTEIIRPDRAVPRQHRHKRSYSMNYKRC